MTSISTVLRFRHFPFLLLLVVLSGCAGTAAVQEGQSLYWPEPPRAPMVKWVAEVAEYRDAGIRKGFWSRIMDAVTGSEQEPITRPYGIFVDREERFFIADADLAVVHVMDRRENRYRKLGGGKRLFLSPIGISGDNAGTIYITDSEAGVVFRYNYGEGEPEPLVKGLQRPTGIAWNPHNGLIYVSETLAHRVSVFDQKGTLRYSFGGRGEAPGKFNFQTDLFIDPVGKVYVTDPLNARIQAFSPDGKLLEAFGDPGRAPGQFLKPKGVAVDSAGAVYVSDALRDAVLVYGANRRHSFDIGQRGQKSGTFWMPSGLYIDGKDRLYVSDTYNRRIQVFQILGPNEMKE